jgi:hypothetical protein
MRKDLETVNDSLNEMTEKPGPYPLSNMDDRNRIGYPFFNFRYTYLELSAHDGTANVKVRETRFENGRVISEECEGALDHDAVHRMMLDAQHQFAQQMTAFMQAFLAFSPFRLLGRSDE